jgi:hypothetical protein
MIITSPIFSACWYPHKKGYLDSESKGTNFLIKVPNFWAGIFHKKIQKHKITRNYLACRRQIKTGNACARKNPHLSVGINCIYV